MKFEDPAFVKLLSYRFKRNKLNTTNIEDVYDRQLYQEHVSSGLLKYHYNLSWKLHVDGVPLSHSSGRSGWPVLLKPNEVPPWKRR